MPNMWKKKMIEQGYNYLDGPIHAMAEFFETRIENLEKSIPPSVPSRNNKKKSKKGKKKVEQGYNYLDGPIQSMVEFFETRIENLEKSIRPSVPSRNKKKATKVPRRRKSVTFNEDSDEEHSGKKF